MLTLPSDLLLYEVLLRLTKLSEHIGGKSLFDFTILTLPGYQRCLEALFGSLPGM